MPSQDSYNYSITKETTLAAGAEVLTIQQPATGARNIHFHGVSIQSPDADCEVTIERNGTAATGTSQTPVGETPSTPASAATGWNTSNVGVGTVVRRVRAMAGSTASLDLSDLWLFGNGTGKNLSIRTASITGDVIITLTFGENFVSPEAL